MVINALFKPDTLAPIHPSAGHLNDEKCYRNNQESRRKRCKMIERNKQSAYRRHEKGGAAPIKEALCCRIAASSEHDLMLF